MNMGLEDSYCRLCAESKPNNKQVDLQADNVKKSEINERLARINAATDFDEYFMPKTVCYDCISTLNKAYSFVVSVKCAQTALNLIYEVPLVKKEKLDCDEENPHEAALVSNNLVTVAVKEESDDGDIDRKFHGSNQESDNEQETPLCKEQQAKNKSKQVTDSPIPLPRPSSLKSSWKNYSWLCAYCKTLFASIEELKTHSMECHKICNPYQCMDCKMIILKLDDFIIHVQEHYKHLKYSCYKCFEEFKTGMEVSEHIISHLTTVSICSGCNTSFTNNDELVRHMDEFCHSEQRRVPSLLQMDEVTCKTCQKSFKTKRILKKHEMIHTERKKDYICEVCDRGFFSSENLIAHSAVHKDERPHKCQICDFACKSVRLLKEHIGVHNDAKPYACSECGRRFRLQRHLTHHSIIHTDIRPHTCPHCQKQFRFRNILNNHLRVHTGVKPYSCEPCQRDFTNWSNYNKHKKRKHSTDTAKTKDTPVTL